jgi:hypothetical protein
MLIDARKTMTLRIDEELSAAPAQRLQSLSPTFASFLALPRSSHSIELDRIAIAPAHALQMRWREGFDACAERHDRRTIRVFARTCPLHD